MFFDKKRSKLSNFYYLERCLYPYFADIVEAMNTLIQERHNHSENCFTSRVSRRMRKVVIYFAKEGSGLAFFIMDLGQISGSTLGNELGVMLRRKGPNKPVLYNKIVLVHFVMTYTVLIEYNIVGDTKASLLRCFFLVSKP